MVTLRGVHNMTIEEAADSLQKHLTLNPEDEGIFCVSHNGTALIVSVNFIYRVEDVTKLNGQWEGFPIIRGRVSCW